MQKHLRSLEKSIADIIVLLASDKPYGALCPMELRQEVPEPTLQKLSTINVI